MIARLFRANRFSHGTWLILIWLQLVWSRRKISRRWPCNSDGVWALSHKFRIVEFSKHAVARVRWRYPSFCLSFEILYTCEHVCRTGQGTVDHSALLHAFLLRYKVFDFDDWGRICRLELLILSHARILLLADLWASSLLNILLKGRRYTFQVALTGSSGSLSNLVKNTLFFIFSERNLIKKTSKSVKTSIVMIVVVHAHWNCICVFSKASRAPMS